MDTDMDDDVDVLGGPTPARGGSRESVAAPWTRRRLVALGVATAGLVSAVIHLSVAGTHFQEYWLFGVFMLVAGWCQLCLAGLAVTRPTRSLWCAGAAGNASIVAVYVVTRTVGDVLGPTPHAVEPVGLGDLACTVLELLVACACAWLLLGRRDRALPARRALTVAVGLAVSGATLLSVALVDGGPEMVMTMRPSSASTSTGGGTSLATSSPAGSLSMPDPTMQMAPGMQMADSTPCTATPTAAQEQAAVQLVDDSWAASQRYQSLAAAQADGYVPLTRPGRPVVHYIDRDAYKATLAGGPVLDVTQPQSLVYANTPHGAVLVAAMYLTSPGGPTPTPGGCLTQWHVHTNLCLGSDGSGVVGAVGPEAGGCPAGSRNVVTPPMLHVWFVPIPGGPLAVDAPDSAVVGAAERVSAPANGRA